MNTMASAIAVRRLGARSIAMGTSGAELESSIQANTASNTSEAPKVPMEGTLVQPQSGP